MIVRKLIGAIRDSKSDIRHPTSDTRDSTPDIRHSTSDIRDLTSDIRHPRSDIRDSTSDIRDLTSEIWHPTSEIRHPTSEIWHPTSDIRDLTSDVFGRLMLFYTHLLLFRLQPSVLWLSIVTFNNETKPDPQSEFCANLMYHESDPG